MSCRETRVDCTHYPIKNVNPSFVISLFLPKSIPYPNATSFFLSLSLPSSLQNPLASQTCLFCSIAHIISPESCPLWSTQQDDSQSNCSTIQNSLKSQPHHYLGYILDFILISPEVHYQTERGFSFPTLIRQMSAVSGKLSDGPGFSHILALDQQLGPRKW